MTHKAFQAVPEKGGIVVSIKRIFLFFSFKP